MPTITFKINCNITKRYKNSQLSTRLNSIYKTLY